MSNSTYFGANYSCVSLWSSYILFTGVTALRNAVWAVALLFSERRNYFQSTPENVSAASEI